MPPIDPSSFRRLRLPPLRHPPGGSPPRRLAELCLVLLPLVAVLIQQGTRGERDFTREVVYGSVVLLLLLTLFARAVLLGERVLVVPRLFRGPLVALAALLVTNLFVALAVEVPLLYWLKRSIPLGQLFLLLPIFAVLFRPGGLRLVRPLQWAMVAAGLVIALRVFLQARFRLHEPADVIFTRVSQTPLETLTLPALIAAAVFGHHLFRRRRRLGRMVWLGVLGLSVTAIYLTQSRGLLLAATVGLGAYPMLSALSTPARLAKAALVGPSALLLLWSVLTVNDHLPFIPERFFPQSEGMQTARGRLAEWQTFVADGARQAPLLGKGFGSYADPGAGGQVKQDYAHNLFVHAFRFSGLFGVVVAVMIFLHLPWRVWRRLRVAALPPALHADGVAAICVLLGLFVFSMAATSFLTMSHNIEWALCLALAYRVAAESSVGAAAPVKG